MFALRVVALLYRKLDGPLSTAKLTRPQSFLGTSPALSGAPLPSTNTRSEGEADDAAILC